MNVGSKVEVVKPLTAKEKGEAPRLVKKVGEVIQVTEYFTTIKFKDYSECFFNKKYGNQGAKIRILGGV